jgi:hypothetical protein
MVSDVSESDLDSMREETSTTLGGKGETLQNPELNNGGVTSLMAKEIYEDRIS